MRGTTANIHTIIMGIQTTIVITRMTATITGIAIRRKKSVMKMIVALVGLVVLLATVGCQSQRVEQQAGYYGQFHGEYTAYNWNSPAAGNHDWYKY